MGPWRGAAVYSFVQAAGGVLGLVAGGVLTQVLNWHWIFFVNLPIGAAAAVLSLRLLPDDRPARVAGAAGAAGATARSGGGSADVPGAVLVTAALMLGVYAIVGTTDHGWASAHTAGFAALSAVLLAAFRFRQTRAAQPLMPLRLFRSRMVSGANLVLAVMVAGGFGFQFLTTLYLQRVLGYDPLRIGLAIAPTGVVIGVMSLALSARLGARFGRRAVLLPSLALFAGGFLLLARAPSAHASYVVDVLPAILVFGVAFGLAMPSLMTLGMSDASPADSGLISGVFNTAQQIGGALGLAVLAALASARTDHRLAAGHHPAAALTSGYHLAFLVAAALLAAATALAAVVLRDQRPRQPKQPKDGGTPATTAPAHGTQADPAGPRPGVSAPATPAGRGHRVPGQRDRTARV